LRYVWLLGVRRRPRGRRGRARLRASSTGFSIWC
jgi:hypothetical protein